MGSGICNTFETTMTKMATTTTEWMVMACAHMIRTGHVSQSNNKRNLMQRLSLLANISLWLHCSASLNSPLPLDAIVLRGQAPRRKL